MTLKVCAAPRDRRLWKLLRLALVALALNRSAVLAQDVTEPALKSALIFNFARFTTWPQDVLPTNAAFVACVVGEPAVADALQRAAKDRRLAGHPITVSQLDPQQSRRGCHVLYVTGLPQKQSAKILADLRGGPVLTILDADNESDAGSIARLFVENGRIRFELDNGLAKQSGLQLSSRLLTLAARVHDGPTSTR